MMRHPKSGRCLAAFVMVLFGGWLVIAAPSNAGSDESLKDGSLRIFAEEPDQPSFRFQPAEPATYSTGSLTVYFVDVGQGDAEYIELPSGRNVLIDGGPPNGKLAEFLARRGVTKIDHLVLTHPHLDHYGGLPYVFDNLQVDNFYDTRCDNAGGNGDDAVRAKAAAEPGSATYYPRAGDYLDWGEGVQVRVLNSCPEEQSKERAMDINACSITLKVTHAGAAILFTGDIGAGVEARLAAEYGGELSADVLKVGHHGSATSSTADFLDKVRPRLAYISAGAGNSYGHPRPPTLGRLGAVGAEIRRTDLEGTSALADHRPVPAGSLRGFPGLEGPGNAVGAAWVEGPGEE